jgi:hypothetical protein
VLPHPKEKIMSTTTLLTVESVDEIVGYCMLGAVTTPVTRAVLSQGIANAFVFDPDKLEERHQQIRQLLSQLPSQFHADGGGGWSFLNLCVREDGEQWTGEHREMEALMCLAVAAGWGWVSPRWMWPALPGSMPYVIVLSKRREVELADKEALEQINRHLAEHVAQEDTITVRTPRCIVCNKPGEVTLPRAAWERFNKLDGEMIQVAWPQGSAGEREQLLNGTHPECFEEIFADSEEDALFLEDEEN